MNEAPIAPTRAPHKIRLIGIVCETTHIIRHRPYPPSFNITPARIMEPSTGASTWALGSHKCKKNIGNFTKNLNTTIDLTTSLINGGWGFRIELKINTPPILANKISTPVELPLQLDPTIDENLGFVFLFTIHLTI